MAPMNAQLIRDEGHRNAMTVLQLAERMTDWLKAEYQGCLFELESKAIGYALYRFEPEYIYLRHFLFNRKCGAAVLPAARSNGCVKMRGPSARACASTSWLATNPASSSGAPLALRTTA